MKRLVENQLIQWKDSPRRKPLILRGARQVGKTWLIEKVLGEKFDHVAVVNLELHQDAHNMKQEVQI